MKSKNANGLVVGIVMTLFVIILTGVIIVWGTGYFSQNKKTMDKSTAKIDKTIGSMADFDLTVYNDKSIRGDALVDLIKAIVEDEVVVSIGVTTNESKAATYYAYEYDPKTGEMRKDATKEPTTDKTAPTYINPNGMFMGEVIRNTNKEIVCIHFTQQQKHLNSN